MKTSCYIAIGSISILFLGCEFEERSESWDLVSTPNGLVYRINKKSGDVDLVEGDGLLKLSEIQNREENKKYNTHVIYWPAGSIEQLEEISLNLKTSWRDGQLHYLFTVSPYSDLIQKEYENPDSLANFFINLRDEHDFKLLCIPVRISATTKMWYEDQIRCLQAEGSMACTLETYKLLDTYSIGWEGFHERSPTYVEQALPTWQELAPQAAGSNQVAPSKLDELQRRYDMLLKKIDSRLNE